MNKTEEAPVGICCICQGPLGPSGSNNDKHRATFKEFQTAWHHPPEGFNYLNICRVTNTAIRWLLNYVEDSFMIQQERL